MQDKIFKQSPVSFQLEGDEEGYHVIKGWATTYGNADLVGDVIAKGAFSRSFKEKGNKTKILWQHDPAQPIGTGTLEDQSNGVMLTARLPKDDEFVKNRVMPQLKAGSVDSFSIGMFFDRTSLEFKNDTTIINDASIFEVSPVTFPANPMAEITSVKSLYFTEKASAPAKGLPLAEMDTTWNSDEADKRVREFTGSTDQPSANYKKAFLYYDASNEDNFTAYKLPFADVIDGELKAVPAGLAAALGAVNGARGGVSIPSSDLPGVKATITAYYKKMGKDDPFSKKQLIIDDVLQFKTVRDIENALRESGAFSKKASTYLASCFDLKQRDFADKENCLSVENGMLKIAEILRSINK